MQITLNLERWTVLKAALAVGAALALGGVVGSAVAIGPTVSGPIKWAGGWEYTKINFSGVAIAYTVPAGKNLMVTDLVLGNLGTVQADFNLYIGSDNVATCLNGATPRFQKIAVPAGGTETVSLTTGIGFASGTILCISTNVGATQVNMRGYLFTPA